MAAAQRSATCNLCFPLSLSEAQETRLRCGCLIHASCAWDWASLQCGLAGGPEGSPRTDGFTCPFNCTEATFIDARKQLLHLIRVALDMAVCFILDQATHADWAVQRTVKDLGALIRSWHTPDQDLTVQCCLCAATSPGRLRLTNERLLLCHDGQACASRWMVTHERWASTLHITHMEFTSCIRILLDYAHCTSKPTRTLCLGPIPPLKDLEEVCFSIQEVMGVDGRPGRVEGVVRLTKIGPLELALVLFATPAAAQQARTAIQEWDLGAGQIRITYA
jgi:hypothetical protein